MAIINTILESNDLDYPVTYRVTTIEQGKADIKGVLLIDYLEEEPNRPEKVPSKFSSSLINCRV